MFQIDCIDIVSLLACFNINLDNDHDHHDSFQIFLYL